MVVPVDPDAFDLTLPDLHLKAHGYSMECPNCRHHNSAFSIGMDSWHCYDCGYMWTIDFSK